ncbi:hypothetical protein RRG08_056533 [Elysia crispata]|uniref:Uncharacterized protein n=1 Tax=Elysia crispata TaxID=231223 RepID=A0AAE0ZLF5_9GAST|nr:hypothetical protein RRG08_056533 [Elysia crispata]
MVRDWSSLCGSLSSISHTDGQRLVQFVRILSSISHTDGQRLVQFVWILSSISDTDGQRLVQFVWILSSISHTDERGRARVSVLGSVVAGEVNNPWGKQKQSHESRATLPGWVSCRHSTDSRLSPIRHTLETVQSNTQTDVPPLCLTVVTVVEHAAGSPSG